MIPSPMNVCQIHGENIQQQMEEGTSAATQDTVDRPLNAFILWSLHQKWTKPFDNMCICAINKHLSSEWKKLTDEEKQPFINEANKLDEQHKRKYPDFRYRPLLWLDPAMNPFLGSFLTNSKPFTFLPITNAQQFRSNLPGNRLNLLAARIPTRMHSARYPVTSEDANAQAVQSVASTSSAAHNPQTHKPLPSEYKFGNFFQKAGGQELNPIDSVHSNANNSSFVHPSCPEPPNIDQEYPLDLSIKKNQ